MNAPVHDQQFCIAPIARIALGKNVRQRPLDERKLEELTESVRLKGVLEPVMLRPLEGDELELVFGYRRYRAAQRAGLDTLPAMVRELTDSEVLELQLAENIDRADMHPLDEADGFAKLLKFPGYDAQRVAEKIGRPVAYVARRLKLLALGKQSRDALDVGDISLEVALLLARIPVEKLQDEALEHITEGSYMRRGEGVMKAAEAAKVIEEHFMLRLAEAPFDITDANLVPKAGACSTCPKRTGTQAELFADVKSPDLCTDPTCHRTKLDALWQIRSKEHKAAGGEVLSQKDSKVLLGHVYGPEAHKVREQYERLDHKEYLAGKSKTLKSLFGKELPPITLARDPESGTVVELVARKDAEAVLRKVRNEKDPKRATNKLSPAEKRKRETERRQAEIHRAIVSKLVENAEQYFGDELVPQPMAQVLVQAAAESLWNDTINKAANRREMPEPKRGRGIQAYRSPNVDRVRAWSEDKPTPVLLGLLLELLVGRDARDDGDTSFKRALKVLGVDAKGITQDVLKRPRGKAEPEGSADDQVDSEVRTCRECGCTDAEACEGGCEWVEDDLCSNCAPAKAKGKRPGKAKAKAKRKPKPAKAKVHKKR